MQSYLWTLLPLVVAYGFVGFIFATMILTVASLAGWIVFVDPKQQRTLVQVLIIQSSIALVGYFTRVLNFNPSETASTIQKLSVYDYWQSFQHDYIRSLDKQPFLPDEYKFSEDNFIGTLKYDSKLNVFEEKTRYRDNPEYHHFFRPVAEDNEFLTIYDDSRNMALKLPQKDGEAFLSGGGPNGTFTRFHFVKVSKKMPSND